MWEGVRSTSGGEVLLHGDGGCTGEPVVLLHGDDRYTREAVVLF
jgi:hypothetical protein